MARIYKPKQEAVKEEKLFMLPSLLQGDYEILMGLPAAQTNPFSVSTATLAAKGIDNALLDALARQGFARKENKGWKVVRPQRRKTAITVQEHNYTDDTPHPLLDQPVPARPRQSKSKILEQPEEISLPQPTIEPDPPPTTAKPAVSKRVRRKTPVQSDQGDDDSWIEEVVKDIMADT